MILKSQNVRARLPKSSAGCNQLQSSRHESGLMHMSGTRWAVLGCGVVAVLVVCLYFLNRPSLMPPMVMDYEVADPAVLSGLKRGNEIHATLLSVGAQPWVLQDITVANKR